MIYLLGFIVTYFYVFAGACEDDPMAQTLLRSLVAALIWPVLAGFWLRNLTDRLPRE